MALFDFDALEELETERKDSSPTKHAVATASEGDSESDILSEVWPGEIPGDCTSETSSIDEDEIRMWASEGEPDMTPQAAGLLSIDRDDYWNWADGGVSKDAYSSTDFYAEAAGASPPQRPSLADTSPTIQPSLYQRPADLTPAASKFQPSPQVPAASPPVIAWEVVYSRIVVRAEPSFDAPIVGICSQKELVFEDPAALEDGADHDWVRLYRRRGCILKDGRKKDPKLSLLLKRYELPGAVPQKFRHGVLEALQDAWLDVQKLHVTGLQPPVVRKLRKAADEAIDAASTKTYAVTFKMGTFLSSFSKGVEQLRQPEPSPGLQMPATAGQIAYAAPRVAGPGGRITMPLVRQFLDDMKRGVLPSQTDVIAILTQAANILNNLPSLVKVEVESSRTLHVVGDIHGQFWDFLHILDMYGEPTSSSLYLFNGDFVDRGQQSVEVALTLMALKVAAPAYVHLNRGNHEAVRMNTIFGFYEETRQKYSLEIFKCFNEAFKCLPLATVVNSSVFVVHGGLSARSGSKLKDIAEVDRKREPDEQADELMLHLLWSDPMERNGLDKSPRGGGILFGPDVTQRFCRDNGLACVVRSHEMKQMGYEWHHGKTCLTVFSAPNYCGIGGNCGAVCNIKPRRGATKLGVEDLTINSFGSTTPEPSERRASDLASLVRKGRGLGTFW